MLQVKNTCKRRASADVSYLQKEKVCQPRSICRTAVLGFPKEQTEAELSLFNAKGDADKRMSQSARSKIPKKPKQDSKGAWRWKRNRMPVLSNQSATSARQSNPRLLCHKFVKRILFWQTPGCQTLAYFTSALPSSRQRGKADWFLVMCCLSETWPKRIRSSNLRGATGGKILDGATVKRAIFRLSRQYR